MTTTICEACGNARGECLTPLGDGALQLCWRCAHNVVHHDMSPEQVDFTLCSCSVEDIFPTSMSKHANALRGFAIKRGIHDPDDLIQDTFARALEFWLSYRPGSDLRVWLFAILRSRICNAHRDRQMHQRLQDKHYADLEYIREDRAVDPMAPSELAVETAVRAAVAQLPPRVRAAVEAIAIDGQQYRDAAKTLGIPLGTVFTRVLRAKDVLRPLLLEAAQEYDLGLIH